MNGDERRAVAPTLQMGRVASLSDTNARDPVAPAKGIPNVPVWDTQKTLEPWLADTPE